ncbi:MAG: hypothetical protein LBD25_02050 [Coriobacteriales bacterium]|jgi:uncharacterized protein YukE|nr:hypothetical protein [Coriobacteriales bacterium]
MADSAFVSADIGKIEKFISESSSAVTEFNAIKDKFGSINSTLVSKWKGVGADSYKHETDHILEKIGSVKDVLDAISTSVTDIKENYTALDTALGDFNKNPQAEEDGKSAG